MLDREFHSTGVMSAPDKAGVTYLDPVREPGMRAEGHTGVPRRRAPARLGRRDNKGPLHVLLVHPDNHGQEKAQEEEEKGPRPRGKADRPCHRRSGYGRGRIRQKVGYRDSASDRSGASGSRRAAGTGRRGTRCSPPAWRCTIAGCSVVQCRRGRARGRSRPNRSWYCMQWGACCWMCTSAARQNHGRRIRAGRFPDTVSTRMTARRTPHAARRAHPLHIRINQDR